jgi:hypothetical protein
MIKIKIQLQAAHVTLSAYRAYRLYLPAGIKFNSNRT